MTPSASFWATRLFQLLLLPLMPLLLLCLANVSCVLSLPTFLISYFSRPAWLAEKLKCCARKRKCQLKSEDNSRAAPTTANFRILSFLRVCSVAFAPVASLQVFPPFASAATGSNKRQKLLQFLLRLMVGSLAVSLAVYMVHLVAQMAPVSGHCCYYFPSFSTISASASSGQSEKWSTSEENVNKNKKKQWRNNVCNEFVDMAVLILLCLGEVPS